MSIDYTSYSDDAVDEVVEFKPTYDVEEEVVEDVVEDTDEYPTMMGVIYNTRQVYMRKEADKDSPHVDILDEDEEVMIDGTKEDKFGNGWYHLITATGNEGYTMSEFVKIVE